MRAHPSRTLPFMAMLLGLAMLTLLSGCTIIRYVDREPEEPDEVDPPPPKVVDMLIMVELDRTTVQLADDYQTILSSLQAGLIKSGVSVRRMAVAPMYRRTGGAVPLIYGEGAEGSEFSSFAEAIGFFALDGGDLYLRDQADSEGENLATLGINLDTAAIYNPTRATTDATPYFTVPADGFIVLQLTARERSCAYGDTACQINSSPAAAYFTEESGGTASWLALGEGKGLSKSKIFFINIATAEGLSEDDFVKNCESRVGFNSTNLDSMEPSARVYYEPFSDAMSSAGGWAEHMDMCEAMSTAAIPKLGSLSGQIAQRLNQR